MSDVPALDFRLPTSGPDAEVIPLARALKRRLPELSWNRLRDLCLAGKVKVDGERVLDGRRQVNPGQHIELDPSAAAPNAAPPPKGALRIMYEDSQIVVIDKPAGVATVPFEDQERVTVLDLVRKLWRETGSTDPKSSMFVVQRLDKDTSGVMVLAKTDQARALLEAQFRKHTLEREYLAVVNGIIERDSFVMDTFIAADRGDGLRGSVASAALGKHAITEVKVVELLAEATLVRCRLETGRTHQVRIHLSERGHPLVGEKVYVRGYEGPQHEAGRQALHAVKLSFRHPLNGRTMQFGSPLPPDLQQLIRTLGGTYVAPEPVTQEKKEARQSWEHEVRDWWKEGPQPAARPARPVKGDKREDGDRRERPARSFDGGDRRERP
ncbi:MAG: RluA family pseudouridine synthase, partial [Myxococcota bacterium]